MKDLAQRVRDIRWVLGTTAVEDGRWTEKAEATLDEAAAALERFADARTGKAE